jgi:hypothetical protein
MKKSTAIACALFLVVLTVQAQAAAKWSAGVKGGVNMGDLSGDDAPDDTSMRNGFMGGAFVGAEFAEGFGVRLEGLYVMKGATAPDDSLTTVDVTTKVDYIEFPVLFVASFPSGEKVNLSVFAGPTFAFTVNAEAEAEGYGSEDISDFVKGFEFGAAFGAGFEYKLSSASIIIDARYSLGATSAAEDDVDTGETIDVKNRGIGIMAGVSFPLGGGGQ